MNHPTVRPLLVPLAASVAVHAAAAPFAAILARCACPLLDRTGFGGVGLAMFVAQLAACAGYWLMQGRWARLWRDAARGLPLADADVASLLGGAFRGVAQHVPACLAGTAAGAFVLRAAYGHDVFNVRFWYSSMLVAGFAVVLHAVLLEVLLARSLARTGTSAWSYRDPSGLLSLSDVVLSAVATLPVGVMTALVHRRVVLEDAQLTGQELIGWLAWIGLIFAAWSVAVVALLRNVQRRAAGEALALIRELDRPRIVRRANLTTGGAWGETASALNVAASSLEQRTRLEHAVRTYVGDELAEATRTSDVTATRPERARMTVLFADIRGFTSRSAVSTPEQVVEMLDAWFERAVGVVEANGGHVDKFLGDGLMAWFDEAPGAADLGAPRAIAAAASLLRCLGEFNADLARRGVAPIRIGVGLHAGDVVRGNLGAGRRKQWTVIGDTVNLASRMESMTKTLGCDIALTSAVAAHLPPQSVKPLGDHEVRGQPKPVACYALRAG